MQWVRDGQVLVHPDEKLGEDGDRGCEESGGGRDRAEDGRADGEGGFARRGRVQEDNGEEEEAGREVGKHKVDQESEKKELALKGGSWL